MKKQVVFALAGLLLVSLACSFNVGIQSTPTPIPPTATITPSPTPLPPTPTPPPPTPTPMPSPTATPPPAPFTLSVGEPYEHPQGIFSLTLPKPWVPIDEAIYGAAFIPEDQTGYFQFTVTNTIFPVRGEALARFAKSLEQVFEDYAGYQIVNQKKSDKVVFVERTLVYMDTPQRIRSYYLSVGTAVLTLDFWADADVADAYFPFYEQWLDDIHYDTDAIAQLPPYTDTWTYMAPNALFQMEVPMAWYYSYEEGNNAVLERFDEPNGLAFIESLAYDDGSPISKSTAGRFALQLLHDYYAQDIKVIDDRVQPDGSERLIWQSKSMNTKGITFFETRGTTFLLLSLVADRDAFDAFSPVFNAVIQSYYVP